MYEYGMMLFTGNRIPIDKPKAAEYFKKASNYNFPVAMIQYGSMLLNGDGIPINKSKAIEYYKKAADLGDSNAILEYGKILVLKHDIESYKKAAELFNKCIHESTQIILKANAMYEYGYLLLDGKVTSQNEEEAASYFKKSADFRCLIAMAKYSLMLKCGVGVKIDKNKSREYDKAILSQFIKYNLDKDEKMRGLNLADSRNYKAIYEFGMLLYSYSLVNEGCMYLIKSANYGYVKAMLNYGIILSKNEEMISESEKYLQRAAYLGDAWFILGSIKYRHKKNKEEGIKYIIYAAKDGYFPAQIWLCINSLEKNGFL